MNIRLRVGGTRLVVVVLTLLCLLLAQPVWAMNCYRCYDGCVFVLGGSGYYNCEENTAPGVICYAWGWGCQSSAPCDPNMQPCPFLDYENP